MRWMIAAALMVTNQAALAVDSASTNDYSDKLKEDLAIFEVALHSWESCVVFNTSGFARSQETADIVATAVLGECTTKLDEVRRRILMVGGGKIYSVDAAEDKIEQLKARWRPMIVAEVIKTRAKAR